MTEEEDKWKDAFKRKLKTKTFEEFSILMFDFNNSPDEQKQLLQNILFNNHSSLEYWNLYLNYCFKLYFDKKSELQFLVNKAIEVLDEGSLREDAGYHDILLKSIELRSSIQDKLKALQSTILKKKIGVKNSMVYLFWANLELENKASPEIALSILKKGLQHSAKPSQPLKEKGTELIRIIKSREKVEFKSSEEKEKVNDDGKIDPQLPEDVTIKMKPEEIKEVIAQSRDIQNKKRTVSFNKSPKPQEASNLTNGIFAEENRFLVLNNEKYFHLSAIGKGGSSIVHKVISATSGNIYALKKVELKTTASNDEDDSKQFIDSYINEILLLKSLKGTSPYIIDLIDHEINKDQGVITLLLEMGDIDLAKLLNQKLKVFNAKNDPSDSIFDPFFARMIWKEMLLAVNHIHDHRIVHGDLKPANFVFVKGHLKLIDFGIAKSISSDTTNIYRNSQIGTINYMAPEAISPTSESIQQHRSSEHGTLSMKLGRASDIWSLGCILYQILYSRPPFSSLTAIQKLTAIPNPKFEIIYPENKDIDCIETIKACLIRDPKLRATITGDLGLLKMKYLTIHSISSQDLNRSIDLSLQSNTSIEPAINQDVSTSSSTESSILIEKDFAEQVLEKIMKSIRKKAKDTILKNPELNTDTNRAVFLSLLNDINQEEIINSLNLTTSQPQSNKMAETIKPFDENIQNHSIFPLKRKLLSSVEKPKKKRSPLKALPFNLKEQILSECKLNNIESEESLARVSKWIKPSVQNESNDLKSAIEKRIDEMRKFLDVEQDDITVTDSIDYSIYGNIM